MASTLVRRSRNQAGVVLPAALIAISLVAVALAAVAFVLTARPNQAPAAVDQVVGTTTPTPSPTPSATVTPRPEPAIKRSAIYVEVFNNSNIKGLAGQVAGQAQAAGWNVVGSDNWYGTIAASTVYAPPRLIRAAHLLAKDLRLTRVKTAEAPMRLDRLTVILTGPIG